MGEISFALSKNYLFLHLCSKTQYRWVSPECTTTPKTYNDWTPKSVLKECYNSSSDARFPSHAKLHISGDFMLISRYNAYHKLIAYCNEKRAHWHLKFFVLVSSRGRSFDVFETCEKISSANLLLLRKVHKIPHLMMP